MKPFFDKNSEKPFLTEKFSTFKVTIPVPFVRCAHNELAAKFSKGAVNGVNFTIERDEKEARQLVMTVTFGRLFDADINNEFRKALNVLNQAGLTSKDLDGIIDQYTDFLVETKLAEKKENKSKNLNTYAPDRSLAF